MDAQMQQLIQIVQQQQQQIAQLLTAQQNNANPAQAPIIPPLPDIVPFEVNQDRCRITEWIERFTFAIDGAAPGLDDKLKVKALMNKLSEQAFSEYSKFCLPKAVTDAKFDETKENLVKLFARPQSIFVDRFECLKASRDEHEDFRQFINRHKRLLKDFEFSKLNEEQFKVLMLLLALKGPKDANLRQRILSKLTQDGDAVTYDKVVEDCINFITTISESKVFEAPVVNRNVHAFNKGPSQKNSKPPQPSKNEKSSSMVCWRCGKDHAAKDCHHKETVCNKCKKKGHIQSRCEAIQEWRRTHPFRGGNSGKDKNVGLMNIGNVGMKLVNSTALLRTNIRLNGKQIVFILDSGADANIIDEETYESIGKPAIQKCNERAKIYDGSTKTFLGKGMGKFEFDGISVEMEFFVAKKGSMNLLSVQAMDHFGLLDQIKERIAQRTINSASKNESKASTKPAGKAEIDNFVISLRQNFPNVFREDLGLCKKTKAHLTLKKDATAIFRRARPVPYNSKEVVEAELDRLESIGVIKKIEHAEWAAPILTVKKANGSARMCCDYSTGLNEALLPNKYPLPVPEDIFATLNGGKYFTQLDLKDAYFQIELDESSRKLCCINTHKGLYELVRLPFGVKTAPSIFQSIMDAMLSDFPFSFAYLDDIIIVGKSPEEHMENVRKVLKRIEEYGFHLKMEKCDFMKKSIKYLGVIIDENGRRPDPEKINAISKMPAPHEVPTLRSFLGMVNHYQQFVKNMRFMRQPLDDLLKKEAIWSWDEKCQKAFQEIKKILESNLLLTHYDPKMDIIVAADASESGIGAVISHRFPDGTIKAIAHASSALTAAQRNYSQIEKEGLALVFAIQKFHKMIYGRHFTLQTDHKPLLAIFGSKKGVKQCSANRLLRWSLMLLAYDFTIEYVKTLEFGQADALSRLIARTENEENERVIASIEGESNEFMDEATKFLPITFQEIAKETAKDEVLRKVIGLTKNGWPEKKIEDEAILQYQRRKDDLTVHRECLMYGERVVIPAKFRKQILDLLHRGHPGMKRMKQLARKYVYWPNIDSQIEDFVRICQPCQNAARAPVKTELHSWPKPDGPWKRIHTDYAGPFFGKEFLIIVDAYSKYPEVFEMRIKSSAATIEKLRYLFSRHGLPETIVSDNGTQFSSSEFANFTAENGVTHLFSAPYNPMSNGQAERFVDTFKRTFRKLKGEGTADSRIIETLLVAYRTTPNDSLPDGKCPAELFLGRKPRTTLDLLKPPPFVPIERDAEMEKQFNRRFGAKPRSFQLGEKVFARHRLSQSWRPGKIVKCTGVIYDVEFQNGSVNRFHANQLRVRHTSDGNDELAFVFEGFGLPIPPVEPVDAQVDEHEQEQNEPEPVHAPEPAPATPSPEQPHRRNPPRMNRRPPRRYGHD